MKSFWRR